MSRLQLALNVADLDGAVEFYSKLFATEPTKRRPGYANFAIVDPPLKLVLFERPGEPRLNHLGIEVSSSDEVRSHQLRLSGQGLGPVEDSGACCFAMQDKVWVEGPDGAWEIYTVLEDLDDFSAASAPSDVPVAGCSCC